MRHRPAKPKFRRAMRLCNTTPVHPGTYYWSEWKADVLVYRKPRSRYLYVTPPGGVEIRVTPAIAGNFKLKEQA